jgi:gamma-glutamyltranspeptidase/glutathione hydrolase
MARDTETSGRDGGAEPGTGALCLRDWFRRTAMAAAGTLAGGVSAWGKMIEGTEVVVSSGAVASEPEDAVRAGARILEAGGNAMDAAAAVALACGLLQPELCGVGGYVLAGVILEGASGRLWSLDANSVAPAAAHERMYDVSPLHGPPAGLNAIEYKCAVRDDANVFGPLAAGVPGQLGGIGMLWERWGKLKWPQIVEPSQHLIAAGIPYRNTARSVASSEALIRKFEPTAQVFLPNGTLPSPDDRYHPRDLAKTLERLASAGWRDFYEGEIGRKIGAYIKGAGGILTPADMAAFQPRVTEPYSTSYRQARVYSAILANGGISCLQALNMLECLAPLPDSEVGYWHRMAEVLKLVWRDRLRYVGDPDLARVPVERLLSKEYAAGRVETIRQFPGFVDSIPGPSANDSGTTHISAGDRHGNLVAITVSHGGLFGSCVTVPGTGVLLGHGMCRFDPHPGLPNSVAGRKRPLNNVCPTIVVLPDRRVALGLRGGRRIVIVATQLISRIVDHGTAARAAAIAPRIHSDGHEPVELNQAADQKIAAGMRALGHTIKPMPTVGGWAHLVELLSDGKIRAGGGVWSAGTSA